MKRAYFSIGFGLLCFAAALMHGCKEQPIEPVQFLFEAEAGEELSGGMATVFDVSQNALGHLAPNISGDRETDFAVGNSFFNQNWVAAPASTTARDGLGPLFNARSCAGCHFKDGRAKPIEGDAVQQALLFRISTSNAANGEPNPHAVYGGQIQSQSVSEAMREAEAKVSYTESTGKFADGESYSLRVPAYRFENLQYGALGTVDVSPRTAPQLSGMGLLENISDADLLANADEFDRNGDGVSGKANYVWDKKSQRLALGRFGWKAGQPDAEQQTADALGGDMGISSSLALMQNHTPAQNLNDLPNGGSPEIADDVFAQVVFYVRTLAVPARRNWKNEIVLKGKMLFAQSGCTGCHTPSFKTANRNGIAELSNQTIRPYTDLLLHDMGDGLADNRADFLASGHEWRTPPLWGIGLIKTVNGHTLFLHDGRARNLQEAILWHGGEAEKSKEAFRQQSKTDRDAIIAFLESL
ncbi:MAG: c-type cytochrome [Rhizobacter sp.]|nr:c-type cytochrome [Chlorobiales bacterium]